MPHAEPGTAPEALYLGLMSGTSVDGIDAALVGFAESTAPTLIAARTFPWHDADRDEILTLSQAAVQVEPDRLARLDHRIGAAFAAAALRLLNLAEVAPARVTAIGSHGQTLRHAPWGQAPFTWQLGDPHLIAERTGITTVADFRRRDVAAGGQGAPLMPAFHHALFASADEDRAVLNLGGIANLTLLPRRGAVTGFDTGPANGLMDAWTLAQRGAAFDADGAFANAGRVDEALLAELLADPWFDLPPPKSTGRDRFHLGWLNQIVGARALPPEDIQATLRELTARSIAQALRRAQPATRRVLACGGGVHNRGLMARLTAALPEMTLDDTRACGLDPDFVEATGFAWLARETLAGRAGNLPSVTGARGARVLGAIHPA